MALPAPERLHWTTSSGPVSVTQTADAQGCMVRCTARGQLLWEAIVCAGATADVRAISPDCEWLAVLRREPVAEPSIPDTVLGAFFRRGRPERLIRAGELPAGSVAVVSDRLRWLGAAQPRMIREGLLVPLLSSRTALLAFAAPSDAKSADPRPQSGAQVSYLDDEGTLHLVEDLEHVPPRYLDRAGPVSGDSINVLPMPRPQVSESETPAAPRRPGAPRPPTPARQRARGPAPYGLTYLEWLQVLSGLRGLGDPNRPACIDNLGHAKQCNE